MRLVHGMTGAVETLKGWSGLLARVPRPTRQVAWAGSPDGGGWSLLDIAKLIDFT